MKCTRICDCFLVFAFLTTLQHRVEGGDAFIKFQQNLEGQDSCRLPAELAFTLNTGSEFLEVNLHRNDHVHPNVPTLTLETDNNGEVVFRREKTRHRKHQAAYQELHHEVALLVTCHINPESGAKYEMEGTLFLKSKKYRLLPSKASLTFYQRLMHSHDERLYHLLHAKEDVPFDAGIRAADHERILANTLEEIRLPLIREKREVPIPVQNISIDVLVVLEYSVIKAWTLWADGDQDAGLLNAKEYFTLLMNVVSLRFKNIVREGWNFTIHLVGFYISKENATSPWSEESVFISDGQKRNNASEVLGNLKDWIGNSSNTLMKELPHDHAMLFTSYDLVGEDSGFRFNYTTGLAYVETMCNTDGSSVSVVEDHGGFQSVGTATHELGHSLGARHDGENNTCPGNQRYIMAPISYNETEATKYNPWFFSSCSVDAFIAYFNSSNKTECLTEPIAPATDIPTVVEEPGQLYKPDEQCRHVFGNKSYLCRGVGFDEHAQICRAMFCYVPEKSICLMITAARGTSCGSKKWCNTGECVYSDEAPDVPATCPHGDQPYVRLSDGGEIFCKDAIKDAPKNCHDESWSSTCCESCGPICTGPAGSVVTCGNYEASTDPPTSTSNTSPTSTSHASPTSTSHTSSTSATTQPSSTSLITSPTSTTPSEPTTCTDKSSTVCESLIQDRGVSSCYHGGVDVTCCKTCQHEADGTREDCPWGDHYPSSCYPLKFYLGEGVCPNSPIITLNCCGTCADLRKFFEDQQAVKTTAVPSSASYNNIILQNVVITSILIVVHVLF